MMEKVGSTRNSSLGAALMIAGLVLTTTGTTTANADPSASSAAESDFLPKDVSSQTYETDIAVDAFVQDVIAKHPMDLQASVDWDSGTILVAAKPPIADDVEAVDGMSVAGLHVSVQPAKFSPADYEEAIRKISAIESSARVPTDRVQSFNLPPDGSYIEASVANLPSLSTTVVSDLRSALADAGGTSVKLANAEEMTYTSRNNDGDPWIGGAVMRHNVASNGLVARCTTGFAVLDGVNGRLLSARHCTDDGNDPFGLNLHPLWTWRDGVDEEDLSNGNNNQQSGSILDSLLIDPVGGTNGVVYGGDWDATSSGTSRYRMSVSGAGSTFVGEHVCTSGAMTGEHCSLTVIAHNDTPCTSVPSGTCHGWNVENYLGKVAVGEGDSGGPVYADTSSDHVGARGILSRGFDNFEVPCGAGGSRIPTTCYSKAYFVGINDLLTYWNVNIETN